MAQEKGVSGWPGEEVVLPVENVDVEEEEEEECEEE